jgi:hypothetical protein
VSMLTLLSQSLLHGQEEPDTLFGAKQGSQGMQGEGVCCK